MYLKTLFLRNFRSYDKIKINFNPKVNIIYGNNAQGKTNLLEGIYVLGMTRSHRLTGDDKLIKDGNQQSKIKGEIIQNKIKTNIEIFLEQKNKQIKVDNKEIKKMGEYIGSKINIIIFYPEDLEIIKGSPNERRNFLNLELSQISNNYYKILGEYNKLLKIRNELLKKLNHNHQINENYFKVITNCLIEKAIIIYKMRYKFINELNQNCGEIFYNITRQRELTIKYVPNLVLDNYETEYLTKKLQSAYQNNYHKEIKILSTIVGPHRDDFNIYLNDQNLKDYGSQGQQRLAVLSIKLAEIPIFRKYKNDNPILLLDDIFSELDDLKKNNIIKMLKNDVQIIITTTDISKINKKIIGNATVFKIKNGQIIRIEEMKE